MRVGEREVSDQPFSTTAHDKCLDEAADAVRRRTGKTARPLAVIAGSGLVGLAQALSVEKRLEPVEIPHLPVPGAPGHQGWILAGRLGPIGTIFFAGRAHLYEGWNARESVFAVELAARLGAKILLATNATGGVNPELRPGNLVLLSDQINLTFRPLAGRKRHPRDPASVHSCLGSPYDIELSEKVREAARNEKINLKDGIYGGMLGPTYETRAESELLGRIGADVVGMSTISEILAARIAGLRVVCISCVANMVPKWGSCSTIAHAEVLDRVSAAVEQLKRLVVRWAEMIVHDANR